MNLVDVTRSQQVYIDTHTHTIRNIHTRIIFHLLVGNIQVMIIITPVGNIHILILLIPINNTHISILLIPVNHIHITIFLMLIDNIYIKIFLVIHSSTKYI
jgi:hypothetical protein